MSLLMGVGWYGIRVNGGQRKTAGADRAWLGWAIRRDWATGCHEFVLFRNSRETVENNLVAERDFWRRGPLRPTLSVVEISGRDFDLHSRARHLCKAPDCPLPATVAVMSDGVR
jgi:hypothetical protein